MAQPGQPVQQPMAQPGQPVQQPMAQPAGQPVQHPMAQPGQPVQQPMAQPGQQPMAQPDGQPDDAFGFQPEQKAEKYDTLYLTSNINQDRKRNQMIIVGIVIAAIAGVTLWLGLMPESKPPVIKKPGDAALLPDTKKPADEAKNAESPGANDQKKEASE